MYSASLPSTSWARFGSRLHQQQPIMCWCILLHPGSVGEGFQEATLFLEPRFFMESSHPALLNIGGKVEQSVIEEKSGTSFTSGKFSAEFGSTLFAHLYFFEVVISAITLEKRPRRFWSVHQGNDMHGKITASAQK